MNRLENSRALTRLPFLAMIRPPSSDSGHLITAQPKKEMESRPLLRLAGLRARIAPPDFNDEQGMMN
ncbi:MAG: hypothetical protein ABSE93_01460 [Terriglobia bacterium]